MARNGLLSADVPLRKKLLTHSLTHSLICLFILRDTFYCILLVAVMFDFNKIRYLAVALTEFLKLENVQPQQIHN